MKIWQENKNVLVSGEWAVGLTPNDAKKYIDTFDKSPHSGLLIEGDKATLTHGNAKLDLTLDEAKDVAFNFLCSKKHANKSE